MPGIKLSLSHAGEPRREREGRMSMAAALISDCKDDVRKISTPFIDVSV